MNPGTIVGMLQSLTSGDHKPKAGERLQAVHSINDILTDTKCRSSAVAYVRQNVKNLDKEKKPFYVCVQRLAKEYGEYKALVAFAEELDSTKPPDGIEVVDMPDGTKKTKSDPEVPVTVRHLDFLREVHALSCGDPECTADHTDLPMIIRSPCHSMIPAMTLYKDGEILMVCGLCRNQFMKIKVASGEA